MANFSEEKGLEPVSQWAFIGFNLHNTRHKAHQSLSGSNDQTIGNIQRTMRAYSDRGQIDIVMSKGHKTLGNKLIPC